jgi:hypothetical protein
MGISLRALMLWTGLIGGMLSCAGCGTKLPPNAPVEGRACFLGAVPPSQVEQVQVWAPTARISDLLINPYCDDEETRRLLNEIRRDTR